MTGRESYAGRYWPTDWRAYYQLKGETIVPLDKSAVPPPGDAPGLGDAYTLFPELASLAALATGTSELLAETIQLSRHQGDSLGRRIGEALRLTGQAAGVLQLAADQITDLDRRVRALEAHAETHGLPPAPAARPHLASCGHPANADGECSCAHWPEPAPSTWPPLDLGGDH